VKGELLQLLDRFLPKAKEEIRPMAVLGILDVPEDMQQYMGKLRGQKRIGAAIYTIGPAVDRQMQFYEKKGELQKAMVWSAIGDVALFDMEKEATEKRHSFFRGEKVGISAMVEAPEEVGIEAHRWIYTALQAEKLQGLGMTEAGMFTPTKTMCKFFELTDDVRVFEDQHNCLTCKHPCGLQELPGNAEPVEDDVPDMTVLQSLREKGVMIDAACNGTGFCGKCKVRILKEVPEPTTQDLVFLSQKELQEGWRLACKTKVTKHMEIQTSPFAEPIRAALDGEHLEKWNRAGIQNLGIAIDLGSTTLAFALVDLDQQIILHTIQTMNHQRSFGADVVSRIQASMDGQGYQLYKTIWKDISRGIHELLKESQADTLQCVLEKNHIRKITLAGNTTMLHLLQNLPCDGLAKYPFTNVELSARKVHIPKTSETTLWNEEVRSHSVELLPGISAFVGADIVAGIIELDLEHTEEPVLFLDLGTNGEMVLATKEKYYATSVAAGPALEGGNISCGVASIPGAIDRADILDGKLLCHQIGDLPPIGICGSGALSLTWLLYSYDLLTANGTFVNSGYLQEGLRLGETPDGKKLLFTQEDIRNIQMAKAAIYAGIHILLKKAGVKAEEVSSVYVAGGFGEGLRDTGFFEAAAEGLGLMPKSLAEKVKVVGNTSLKGAVKALWKEITLHKPVDVVELSLEPDFEVTYLEQIDFPSIKR
jgi:uncharacterized 2Fe-2S/4Fe-4S cluster protein (DUF4445 family)